MDIDRYWSARFLPALLILALPLGLAATFSTFEQAAWFARALLSLTLAAGALAGLLALLQTSMLLRILLAVLLCQFLTLVQLARLTSFYLQGESFNERFFFNASLNTLEEGVRTYPQLFYFALAMGLLSLVAACLLAGKPGPRPKWQLGGSVLALLVVPVLDPDLSRLGNYLQKSEIATAENSAANWEALGLNLTALNPISSSYDAGKNLVFIYLEGLEAVFTDASLFPGLTPYLSSVRKQGLDFTGLRESAGTNWTIAGLVASQCGTPLVTPMGPRGNDIMQNDFLDQAVCLGDVLAAARYHQVFMGGANSSFSGKGRFLEMHGYDEVLGRQELVPLLPNPQYQNDWGLQDDSLFELAYQKFESLAAGWQPFNLSMLTVDTHQPGYPSASCEPYTLRQDALLDAIHCTDQLLERFIGKLQDHPAWEDTLVVLMSDHRLMRPNLRGLAETEPAERPLLLTVLNADTTGENQVAGTSMDIAPTLLGLLDIEPRRAFLAGQDLLEEATAARNLLADPAAQLSALRYINFNLLTRKDAAVCEQAPLLEAGEGELKLNGQKLWLSSGGRTVTLDELGEQFSFASLLTPEHTVQSSQVLATVNVPYLLYQTQQYYTLLLTSNAIASRLAPLAQLDKPIAVLLAGPRSNIDILGQYDSVEEIYIGPDCLGAFDSQGPSEVEDWRRALSLSCPAELVQARFDEAELELDRVAVDNQWYSASLKRDLEGVFKLTTSAVLGPISEQAAPDFCHAWLSNSQLLIPRVQTEQGLESMVLEQIPGQRWQFRLEQRGEI